MLYGPSWDRTQAFAVTNRQLMACLPLYNYYFRYFVRRTEKQRELFLLTSSFFFVFEHATSR